VKTSPATIILTGATGFIGSAVLVELNRRKIRTLILLRPGSDRGRLPQLAAENVFIFSKLDGPELAEKLRAQQPAIFIHCAWRGVGGQDRNAGFQLAENVPLALTSVNLAAACGCRQWVGLGSQAEYGNANHILNETAPTNPTTLYGKAKFAAGQQSLALCKGKNLAGAWLRVFSTYGPGDQPHWMIPHVIREFLAGHAPQVTRCEQKWDYLFVADAARAIASVADGKVSGVFNLGSGEAWPLKKIIETIRVELKTSIQPAYGAIPYRPDQVMHLQADIAKLCATTDWKPQVSLEDGIRETVAHEKKLFETGGALVKETPP
jgi:nucleoside-diphosphate-sugar epimerase